MLQNLKGYRSAYP